jgi:lysophospholipase L1-like esterase
MTYRTLSNLSLLAAVATLFALVCSPTRGAAIPNAVGTAPDAALARLAPGAESAPWAAAFEGFDAADASSPPAPGGVLFVGSSSIRLWSDLDHEFSDAPMVLNRGFGGSQLSDCVKNLNRLVVRYQPRTVFVYAGDNDLAEGATPEEVAKRFARFVAGVHEALPTTRIEFISIKPSPARIALLPQIRATNELIRSYTLSESGTEFIDVYSAMLDTHGAPRPELFRADALHLNADGYALWRAVIAPHVH